MTRHKKEETIALKILSPQGLELETQASFVKIPTQMGEIGILYNHTPLISMLKAGELSVWQNQKSKKNYLISEGFAYIEPHLVTILTSSFKDKAASTK